ncbi:MAG: FkbM family methyltransferase [Chitinophagaceae bacterium]|nr:FkbM family methyltransferase [Chitinophagaceae bacterium]
MASIQGLSSVLQALPSFRGKGRLGRMAVNFSGASKQKEFVVKTKAGTFLIPNLRDSISLDLFVFGFYEKGLVKLLVEKIPREGVFIDVGANIGSICIPVARQRPDITVIAIEASPWIFRYLKKNVELNGVENITPVNFAVYHQSGLSMPMYAPRDLFGKGSLKAVYTSEGEMVQTITIDDVKKQFGLPAIHFMKVDVEGFEASVFNGMKQTAVTDKPKVIFEFSEWAETEAGYKAGEAQSILLSKGYKLQQFDHDFKLVEEPFSTTLKGKNANLFAV